MRMIMKVSIPVETGNRGIADGSLQGTIQKFMAEAKPEAAYFTEDNGDRTAYFFLDMTDSSQLPALAEPFFQAFNARLTIRPAMNLQDLMKAGPAIERAVKNYGRGAS
jgi:hypothetical protein